MVPPGSRTLLFLLIAFCTGADPPPPVESSTSSSSMSCCISHTRPLPSSTDLSSTPYSSFGPPSPPFPFPSSITSPPFYKRHVSSDLLDLSSLSSPDTYFHSPSASSSSFSTPPSFTDLLPLDLSSFFGRLRSSFYGGLLRALQEPNGPSTPGSSATNQRRGYEDNNVSVPEVIQLSGYPFEVHHVVTEDGYILELFRIPRGQKNRASGEPRQPVLLQHGLLGSSSTWVLQEKPEKNLPMLLADDGYDVWLANSRGSEYAQRHLTLGVDDPKFWNFSFDQMALFDLPATVDYILEQSPADDLLFVGFSMGSRILVAMLNVLPEYNSKGALEAKGVHKIDFRQPFVREVVRLGCLWMPLCLILYASSGLGVDVNKEFLSVQLTRGLSVTSTTNYAHYAQLIRSGRFTKFDFGTLTNREVYGQDAPPEYHPDAALVPVFLFSGTKDYQASPEDGAVLARSLPRLVSFELVKGYNHFDFVMGLHAEQKVYQAVLNILRTYP